MITAKQKELDIIKWNKSQEIGKDACGTFDYCAKCDKSLENPCDKAFTAFNKKANAKAPKTAKTATTKTATKKSCKKN